MQRLFQERQARSSTRRFFLLGVKDSVGEHWHSERRTIRVGLVAHGVSAITGLAAGLMLVALAGTIQKLPGLLLLITPSIGMRGNIFGAMGSRLGTAMVLGDFQFSIRKPGPLRDNLIASAPLVVLTAAFLAVSAWVFAGIFNLETMSLWDLMVISGSGAIISSVLVAGFTIAVAAASARFRWDLDSIAAPLVTLAGDFVGVPAIALSVPLAMSGFVSVGTALALLALGIGSAYWVVAIIRGRARRIFAESLPVLALVGLLSLCAGAILQEQQPLLLQYQVFLMILPSFLEACGGFGGMYTSRLSTKIHLGLVEAKFWPQQMALVDATLIYLFAVIIFPLVAIIALIVTTALGAGAPSVLTTLATTISAGLVATTLTLIVGYYAAQATVRFGLDPDNHSLPLVTSSMDLLGSLCLTSAIIFFT